MEQGTDINATRVDKVYSAVVDALNAGKVISAQAELVYQIEMLSQEVNSGGFIRTVFSLGPGYPGLQNLAISERSWPA